MSSKINPPTTKSPWTWSRIGLLIAGGLLLAAIGSALWRKNDPAAPAPGTTARTGGTSLPSLSPAVMDAQFNTLDGQARKLSDYSGKVLIVDLWATWCGPCRQEIPHLIQIANDYKDKGVEVLGLTNENPRMDGDRVREFTQAFKINYAIGFASPQIQAGLMRGRNGIPQTLIIGRDGKILNHFVGFSAAISVPQMKAALQQAVAST